MLFSSMEAAERGKCSTLSQAATLPGLTERPLWCVWGWWWHGTAPNICRASGRGRFQNCSKAKSVSPRCSPVLLWAEAAAGILPGLRVWGQGSCELKPRSWRQTIQTETCVGFLLPCWHSFMGYRRKQQRMAHTECPLTWVGLQLISAPWAT